VRGRHRLPGLAVNGVNRPGSAWPDGVWGLESSGPENGTGPLARGRGLRVFAESGGAALAHELGAVWAGAITDRPPLLLDAIIDTTPVWRPVVEAMASLRPGGRLVINAIRKEDLDKQTLLEVDYARHIWWEKEIKSVANVTRQDVREFLQLVAETGITPLVREYPLCEANQALIDLKRGGIPGAKVLRISEV